MSMGSFESLPSSDAGHGTPEDNATFLIQAPVGGTPEPCTVGQTKTISFSIDIAGDNPMTPEDDPRILSDVQFIVQGPVTLLGDFDLTNLPFIPIEGITGPTVYAGTFIVPCQSRGPIIIGYQADFFTGPSIKNTTSPVHEDLLTPVPEIFIDVNDVTPECSDTVDNDMDGKIDFGAGPANDPECFTADDETENVGFAALKDCYTFFDGGFEQTIQILEGEFETPNCFVPTFCGDEAIQSPNDDTVNEVCDGDALGGTTCEDVAGPGFIGTLSCDGDCLGFNDFSCTKCGNGTIDAGDGEACDGGNFGGLTCDDVAGPGFIGDLSCTGACAIDPAACTQCGNGALDAGEACDASLFDPGESCPEGQTLACNGCITSCSGGGRRRGGPVLIQFLPLLLELVKCETVIRHSEDDPIGHGIDPPTDPGVVVGPDTPDIVDEDEDEPPKPPCVCSNELAKLIFSEKILDEHIFERNSLYQTDASDYPGGAQGIDDAISAANEEIRKAEVEVGLNKEKLFQCRKKCKEEGSEGTSDSGEGDGTADEPTPDDDAGIPLSGGGVYTVSVRMADDESTADGDGDDGDAGPSGGIQVPQGGVVVSPSGPAAGTTVDVDSSGFPASDSGGGATPDVGSSVFPPTINFSQGSTVDTGPSGGIQVPQPGVVVSPSDPAAGMTVDVDSSGFRPSAPGSPSVPPPIPDYGDFSSYTPLYSSSY